MSGMPDEISLSLEDIKKIYNAGMRRGGDEACAYEWGSRASGGQYDELCQELHDYFNAGIPFDAPAYVTYDRIEEWVNKSNG